MTKSNIEDYDIRGTIKACPRCGSKSVNVKKKREGSVMISTIFCEDCGHSITGHNAQYIYRKWNTDKKELVEYTVDLLRKNPYTAYISDYLAETWCGVSKLCKYLGNRLGIKVVAKTPTIFNGKGYILEALYEEAENDT
jgi:enolase